MTSEDSKSNDIERQLDLESTALNAAINRENKRSMVRRLVTYAMTGLYTLGAIILIGFLLVSAVGDDDPTSKSLYVQAALGVFSGVAAASLGIVGYWFGNREITKAGTKGLHDSIAAFQDQKQAVLLNAEVGDATSYEDKLQAAYEASKTEILGRYANVIGVSMGNRFVKGEARPERVLRVHVDRKQDMKDLKPFDQLPPVDVLMTSVAAHTPQNKYVEGPDGVRLYSGAQIKVGNSLGTLGAIVRNLQSGKFGILTAAHVVGEDDPSRKLELVPIGADSRIVAEGIKSVTELDAAYVELIDVFNDRDELEAMKIDGRVRLSTPLSLDDIKTKTLACYGEASHLHTGTFDSVVHMMVNGVRTDQIWLRLNDPFRLTENGDSGAVWFDRETGHTSSLHTGLVRLGVESGRPGEVRVTSTLMSSVLSHLNCELL